LNSSIPHSSMAASFLNRRQIREKIHFTPNLFV
jgi:hypothetical protein